MRDVKVLGPYVLTSIVQIIFGNCLMFTDDYLSITVIHFIGIEMLNNAYLVKKKLL